MGALRNHYKNSKAIIIQKFIRGYKVNKKYEEDIKKLKLQKTFEYFDEIHFRVLGTDLQIKLARLYRKIVEERDQKKKMMARKK